MSFTADWVSQHDALWRRVLATLVGRDGARMLEIGSYEGRSACWFLEHVLTGAGATLTCIDPWVGPEWERAMERFDANTAAARAGGRLVKVRASSRDVAQLAPGPWAAIYIDGDHRPEAALSDAARCWPLLEVGGVLIFDDYALPDYGTAAGVDTFLRAAGDRLELLERGWQVVVRKVNALELPTLICPLHVEAHADGFLCGG